MAITCVTHFVLPHFYTPLKFLIFHSVVPISALPPPTSPPTRLNKYFRSKWKVRTIFFIGLRNIFNNFFAHFGRFKIKTKSQKEKKLNQFLQPWKNYFLRARPKLREEIMRKEGEKISSTRKEVYRESCIRRFEFEMKLEGNLPSGNGRK